MKSTDNLSPRRMMLWKAVRWIVPRHMRWYYEGNPHMRGQLWYAERKLLYETVRSHRPMHCFEIGTWRGGGSTLFISQALKDGGHGMLHTVEINEEFYRDAVENYRRYLPQLHPHVTFHHGDYKSSYKKILLESERVDFLILDGAEDAEETLNQYDFFQPYIKPNAALMVHDWFTEKTRLLKPLIDNSNEWEIKQVLRPPISLGLMLAIRK